MLGEGWRFNSDSLFVEVEDCITVRGKRDDEKFEGSSESYGCLTRDANWRDMRAKPKAAV